MMTLLFLFLLFFLIFFVSTKMYAAEPPTHRPRPSSCTTPSGFPNAAHASTMDATLFILAETATEVAGKSLYKWLSVWNGEF